MTSNTIKYFRHRVPKTATNTTGTLCKATCNLTDRAGRAADVAGRAAHQGRGGTEVRDGHHAETQHSADLPRSAASTTSYDIARSLPSFKGVWCKGG